MVRLTRTVVLQGISRVSVDKKDALMIDEQFGKVTSLHLQAKNIDILDSLKLFTSLTNLYLYENRIRVIEGLEQARNLENLHLQRNKLQRLENLEKCTNLKRLYLGYNEIQVIEGLEEITGLIELHVEQQRLPPGVSLIFSPLTIATLASTLIVLNIAGNQIKTIEDLTGMEKLDTLYAEKNKLENLDDTILITSTLRRLRILNLKENPICKNRKYKEKIIGYSENIEVLDGKDITDVTRDFIKRFCNVKAARLEQAVKKYGRIAAEQLASKNALNEDTFRSPGGSRTTNDMGNYNQWQQSQATVVEDQQNQPTKEFTFSTPIVTSPRTVGTIYPSQEEWSRLLASGQIPAGALARMMMPENITVPDFVLRQQSGPTSSSAQGDEYETEYEASDTTTKEMDYDENITTWYEDTQGLYTNYPPSEPGIAPMSMTPKSPEPLDTQETEDIDEKKMSDMAKVIFRLSNLSSPSANKSNLKYNPNLTPVWMKPGTSLPETRPLSPLERPLEVTSSAPLSSNYVPSSAKTEDSKAKKSQTVRSGVRKQVPVVPSPAPAPETILDDNPPFITTVLELPPWPHITRRMGTGNRKITFMP